MWSTVAQCQTSGSQRDPETTLHACEIGLFTKRPQKKEKKKERIYLPTPSFKCFQAALVLSGRAPFGSHVAVVTSVPLKKARSGIEQTVVQAWQGLWLLEPRPRKMSPPSDLSPSHRCHSPLTFHPFWLVTCVSDGGSEVPWAFLAKSLVVVIVADSAPTPSQPLSLASRPCSTAALPLSP